MFELYDFQPALSPEDFDRICKEDGIKKKYNLTKVIKKDADVQAKLMRGMIICGHCDKPFHSNLNKKPTAVGVTSYYRYRCATKGCSFQGKSIRAKVVIEAASEFIRSHPLATKRGYDRYVKDMQRIVEIKQR
jgi:hypothetical protein